MLVVTLRAGNTLSLRVGCCDLGTVVGPSDIRKGRRKIVEELARDLDPASRESIIKILDTWKGDESEEQLRKLLGKKLSKRILPDVE